MKIVNMDNPVTSHWLRKQGCRFDCKPFLSGAVEARILLEKLKVRKEPLQKVTLGGLDGIYHAGREGRTWVDDPEYGIPFLGSSDILNADLSHLPLLSKRQVLKNPKFTIRKDWTLITRSGTVGRMVYSREDMDGMACSEHVMRVVPDPEKIPPGYLYAFLSSRFGVPLVVSGTYGAIIQHIEPEHIANLPVPRLGKGEEEDIHNRVLKSAVLRSKAARQRADILREMEKLIGWEPPIHECANISQASSSDVLRRFDAFHHSIGPLAGRNCLFDNSLSVPLADLVEDVFEPNRGARMKVENPDAGSTFLSSSAVFRTIPQGDYLISRKTKDFERLQISDRDLLLPRSGQLGGIIGHAVLPLQMNIGHCASEHLVRIRAIDQIWRNYLFAVFATEPGYLATIGTAFGSSIPSLDSKMIAEFRVPVVKNGKREAIADAVAKYNENLSDAALIELSVVKDLESNLEKKAMRSHHG
ncbi:MAG: restriction endonuclease subunit S [Bacteroidetes bacterium]|nr:restriction endonuclease subunit S [Bacteroidota bacterium]